MIYFFIFQITTGYGLLGQSMNGYIRDSLTNEVLIGATISIPELHIGTVTNNYGYYSLSYPITGLYEVIVNYTGYYPKRLTTNTSQLRELHILLTLDNHLLEEVVISSKSKDQNISQARMSVMELPIKDIKSIVMIAGERDILKAIQFLPGVQSGNEGSTGFYVRGGNIDQNLVLLDEATIYNPNHLFGLFSTFNVNALNNVTLIKGGFPAQYGGRLSSILDITMREGNQKRFQAEGGIGLLSSNLTLEGPIQKGKSSYIVSGRRSYADIIAKPFLPKNVNQTNYYLYDYNAKINYELGKKDHLFLSIFRGLDDAQYTASNSLNYQINFGNTTGTFRWNHLIGNKIFINTAFIYNDYHLSLSTTQNNYYSLLYTGINDKSAKSALEWYPNSKHNIKTGIQYTYHALTPSAVSAKIPKKGARKQIKPDSLQQQYSNELAAYINDEWTISSKVGMNIGMRIPYFINKSAVFSGFEPRITIKSNIDASSSIKIAYTEMNQFLHLVPNSTASLPTDIWINSSLGVKPQNSKQIALGYFKNFHTNDYETSFEVYYKNMKHQVLFQEGTQIVLETDISKKLTFGSGKSYGAEFFIRKNNGKLNGWIAYTLSKTTQQFSTLNFGKEFPFTYDRRHVLNVVANYQLSKRWQLSANFVLNSGGAYTLPNGKVPVFEGGNLYDNYYSDYVERNNYRLNPYHRLDIGASYKKKRKLFKKEYDSEWVFSLYNVYSRLNPYFVYLTTDLITKTPVAKQVSLLPIVPGVSYNFKF
ncbi:MAG: TonB-dependent receptor [Saprospiraceae bacterium]|uniref:TonB-dependent receptor n=1 Tax=Candidatus Defluviibacterium haderslevense TaxID=2981993 RepID=A0A9D7S9U6_9BACT|nr:TonB-dependent receptor [Candidatus Defluviibacterium haderslevense]